MYGPTGVGFLWGKSEILEAGCFMRFYELIEKTIQKVEAKRESLEQGMPPWKGGGEMIKEVHMVPGQIWSWYDWYDMVSDYEVG